MKEIVVISGKGGTGKTSITAALAFLLKNKAVIADCDVDASDLHLLLHPENIHTEDFYSGEIAKINQEVCNRCGLCNKVCRFDAIEYDQETYNINELDCEGCGYCFQVCPEKAITMNMKNTGRFFIGRTRLNSVLVHAKLNIGADNSGKLVSKIRNEASLQASQNRKDIVLIDGSPGIGCPVIASVTGADYVLFVTETSVSGYHDLERIYDLTKKFKLKVGCIINKSDLNININHKIKLFLEKHELPLLSEIPYSNVFTKAIQSGKTLIEYDQDFIGGKLLGVLKTIADDLGIDIIEN